jgi:hypothetical protein
MFKAAGKVIPTSLGYCVLMATMLGISTNAKAEQISSVVWVTPSCEPQQVSTNATATSGVGKALFNLLLGPLVEAGVKGIGDAIAKAGKPEDIKAFGSVDTNLYSAKIAEIKALPPSETVPLAEPKAADFQPKLGFARPCIVAAFGPQIAKTNRTSAMLAMELNKDSDARPPLVVSESKLTLNKDIKKELEATFDFNRTSVFVAQMDASPVRTAFRFLPIFVRIGQSFDTRR